MEQLTKEQILAQQDQRIEQVDVPEWGGTIWVRSLTGSERDHFEASNLEQRGGNQRINLENMRAKLLVLTLCDKDGKRLFDDTDARVLGQRNAKVLDRLFDKAQELSGLRQEDFEELEGNSGSGQSAASISDSL